MIPLTELVRYCDLRLDAPSFSDYCPNGLQVEGKPQVGMLVTGVTASMALIEAAIAARADALLVHHGYFWKNEPAPLAGVKGARVRALIRHDINLLAYHLPLDAHSELGNNAQLGYLLRLADAKAVDEGGLLWGASLEHPQSAAALTEQITKALRRKPLTIVSGNQAIRRLAWCSGAAQSSIVRAAELGFDAYLSGEISEATVHLARELGVHYFCAGHHATERLGVKALGEEIAAKFGIGHSFIDIENPI